MTFEQFMSQAWPEVDPHVGEVQLSYAQLRLWWLWARYYGSEQPTEAEISGEPYGLPADCKPCPIDVSP